MVVGTVNLVVDGVGCSGQQIDTKEGGESSHLNRNHYDAIMENGGTDLED